MEKQNKTIESYKELLRRILYKSNLEYCFSAEDMQSNLDEIYNLIVDFDSSLKQEE